MFHSLLGWKIWSSGLLSSLLHPLVFLVFFSLTEVFRHVTQIFPFIAINSYIVNCWKYRISHGSNLFCWNAQVIWWRWAWKLPSIIQCGLQLSTWKLPDMTNLGLYVSTLWHKHNMSVSCCTTWNIMLNLAGWLMEYLRSSPQTVTNTMVQITHGRGFILIWTLRSFMSILIVTLVWVKWKSVCISDTPMVPDWSMPLQALHFIGKDEPPFFAFSELCYGMCFI